MTNNYYLWLGGCSAVGMGFLFPCAAHAHARDGEIALRGHRDDVRGDLVTCRQGDGECFTLAAVTIDGATVFSQAELSSDYVEYLARSVSAADMARVADAITSRYRAAGFFLSRAVVALCDPSGLVRISVLEGRIAEVVYEGDGARQAQRFMRGFDTGAPTNLADLDHRLALAADTPGLSIQSRIEPDPDDLTRHRLVITANLQRLAARMYVDDHGSDDVGPWQGYARVSANSLIAPGDQAALTVYTTPLATDEFTSVEASYAYGFENGARVGAAISVSRSHDGADVASSNAGGDGETVGLGFEYPLLRRRGSGLWASAGLSARHIEHDWAGWGGYVDDVRVARFALRGLLNESGRSTTIFVETSFGLGLLGASGHSIERRSRFDADGQFATINLHLSHYQDLGQHFGVYASVDGQWSQEPLLLSEEFDLGGLPYGRAYQYSEISGDRGLAGSVEFRAGYDPGLDPLTFVQGYAFLDGGQVWNVGPMSDSAALASTGVGLRVTLADRVRAGIELARPLTRLPDGETDREWRQFFSLSAWY